MRTRPEQLLPTARASELPLLVAILEGGAHLALVAALALKELARAVWSMRLHEALFSSRPLEELHLPIVGEDDLDNALLVPITVVMPLLAAHRHAPRDALVPGRLTDHVLHHAVGAVDAHAVFLTPGAQVVPHTAVSESGIRTRAFAADRLLAHEALLRHSPLVVELITFLRIGHLVQPLLARRTHVKVCLSIVGVHAHLALVALLAEVVDGRAVPEVLLELALVPRLALVADTVHRSVVVLDAHEALVPLFALVREDPRGRQAPLQIRHQAPQAAVLAKFLADARTEQHDFQTTLAILGAQAQSFLNDNSAYPTNA